MQDSKPHRLAGCPVQVSSGLYRGKKAEVVDWFSRLHGDSWKVCDEDPAAEFYAERVFRDELPLDDQVVEARVEGETVLLHVNEFSAN